MTSHEKRIDIVSDTHGRLSPELLTELSGADLIVHAGDITSDMDLDHLRAIAPVQAVLGNNDHFFYDYGPDVTRLNEFEYEGLRFAVSHYREDLPLDRVDIAVCGHSHVPVVAEMGTCVLINPGSPTFPRTARGATMARAWVADGALVSAEIIEL